MPPEIYNLQNLYLTYLVTPVPLEWYLPVGNTRQFLYDIPSSVTYTTNSMLVKQELVPLGLHLL